MGLGFGVIGFSGLGLLYRFLKGIDKGTLKGLGFGVWDDRA